MAFADPISITVNGAAKSMPRIEVSGRKAVYQTADGLFTTTITQLSGKNGSRKGIIRFDQKVNATDPFDAAKVVSKTNGISVMFDIPEFGFTATTVDQQTQGLFGFLATANVTKIFGGES